MMLRYKSRSPRMTAFFGKLLAKKVRETHGLAGTLIIALEGNVGSGKTTFVKGFVRGCGVRKTVLSPSFLIFKKYPPPRGNKSKIKTCVYHFDLYRLGRKNARRELQKLGWDEIVSGPNIILLEWAEKTKSLLPKQKTAWLKFGYGEKENERTITIKSILLSSRLASAIK